jgi:hypothetical protein
VPEGWDEKSKELEAIDLTKAEQRRIRRQLSGMTDPSPGKSGIVRDRELRDQIRKCLSRNGLDPDDFSKDQIGKLMESSKLKMSSGIPIRSIVLLRTNTEPVIIPQRYRKNMIPENNTNAICRTDRVYIGGNNHHVEILTDTKTGKWAGEFVSTFEAAKRARSGHANVVNRLARDGKQFVMSLSEGEIIHAKRNDRESDSRDAVGYYIVTKLDRTRNRIVFAPHWDARRAGEQDRWECTPAGLRDCGADGDSVTQKVTVDPLGRVLNVSD